MKHIYTLSKKEALEILQKNGVTNSDAMLLRWCRQGKIDAIRVVGRSVNERGVFINPISLNSFIVSGGRSEDVEKLYLKISQLEQEKSELQARVDFLENKYVKKK